MLKKITWFIYKNTLRKILNREQKLFFIRLFNLEIKASAKNRVQRIVRYLYYLGFTERPLADLSAICNDDMKPYAQKHAVFELARWHANQDSREEAQKCLDLLSSLDKEQASRRRLVNMAILEAGCHEKLGDLASARQVIEDTLEKTGPGTNLYLAAANLERSLSGRVNRINQALELAGLGHISFDPEASEPALEHLKPFSPGNYPACNLWSGGTISKLKYALANMPGKKDKSAGPGDVPLVSVIIPLHDEENFTIHALQSILAQSWPNLEVIVVAGGNFEDAVSLVEKYSQDHPGLKLIRSGENHGPFEARNRGLSVATGEFATAHEPESWAHPEKIARQAGHLLANPSTLGNISQAAASLPGLKFYRGDNPGYYCFNHPGSFMFRRKPVLESAGYFDCVKLGANREYINRIIKIFGEEAVAPLTTGPLSFIQTSADPLKERNVFPLRSFYRGALNEYFEAQAYHHEDSENLYYDFPAQERPFPVPELMLSGKDSAGNAKRRHFDVILASDFRMHGGSTISNIEELKVQRQHGIRTGLIQMHHYPVDPERFILPQVRELIDGDLLQVLVHGDKVSTDVLLVRYPPVLMEKQCYIPEVEASDVRVIVNQTPLSHYGEDGVVRYEIEKCRDNLLDYFNNQGTWHPIGPQVRQALNEHHHRQLSSINFSGEDWVNIINLAEWRRSARPPKGDKIRIGRHSRDNQVKWSDDPEELLSVYPDSDDFEIHVLGGAKTAKQVLGYLPKNWHVREFGEMEPKEFLSHLDVFVYYTHPYWVESFGRVIIEAMAVGVPVILPPVYYTLFDQAAIYAEPEKVQEKIYQLINDDHYYEAQVEKAQDYVEKNFGYTKHVARIQQITGKKIFMPSVVE